MIEKWVRVESISSEDVRIADALVTQPSKPLKLKLGQDKCGEAALLVHCEVPLKNPGKVHSYFQIRSNQ